MRQKILELLKENKPRHLSGEEMARRLNVSRTAVWKNINTLQAEGYSIEGSPRLGYRLLSIPDLLYPAEITSGLQTRIVASSPKLVHYFKEVDSTNRLLKKIADEGAPEGTVVVAEEQKQGKGRLGRSWSSPPGKGIWLSILLKPRIALQDTPLFTLLAAVAAVKAIKNILPDLPVGIKWPNDILLRRRKICGILTELKAEADLLHYLVIGIGINVNSTAEDFPPVLRDLASSLYLGNNRRGVSRRRLAGNLLQNIDLLYENCLEKGPAFIIAEWKKYNLTLGQQVNVTTSLESYLGIAVDLAPDGALIVENEKKERRHFHAGEVSLRRSLDDP
jgi:BirA family biotin operon repressor/biotin-[acetyl-CoA-carboxylase] ligase